MFSASVPHPSTTSTLAVADPSLPAQPKEETPGIWSLRLPGPRQRDTIDLTTGSSQMFILTKVLLISYLRNHRLIWRIDISLYISNIVPQYTVVKIPSKQRNDIIQQEIVGTKASSTCRLSSQASFMLTNSPKEFQTKPNIKKEDPRLVQTVAICLGDLQRKFFRQSLRTCHCFSDFWFNIVKVMGPRVALGLTLNIFWFYLGEVWQC